MLRYRFPVEALDRGFFSGPGDPMRLGFMFEILWEQPPPAALVQTALQRLMGRYPILTCRLVARWARSAWEGPYGDPVTRVLETRALPGGVVESATEALRDLLMSEPLDVAQGDLWKITQVPLPAGRALWFVHVHHSVGDAHGWLQVLDGLLEGISDPKAASETDRSPRDLIPCLARAGRPSRFARVRRRVASPWRLTSETQRHYNLFSLEPTLFRRARNRARASQSTLTDVIHGAVARAIENLGGPVFRGREGDRIRLLMAVDCRFLTRAPIGLANFTRVAPLEIPCPVPQDWAVLLPDLRERKTRALHSPMMTRAWLLRVFRTLPLPLFAVAGHYLLQRPFPQSGGVTNFGAVDPWLPHASRLPISTVQSVVFCVPAMPLVVTVSSFREQLTVATGIIAGALPGGRLEEMPYQIRRELEQFAGA